MTVGLRPVRGVTQITMRRNKNVLFVIDRPDVFKAPGCETYIVFGEARVSNSSASFALNNNLLACSTRSYFF